jgi:hypothetical protein
MIYDHCRAIIRILLSHPIQGPELPKEKGQEAAQEGGETLEGMYALGCESLGQARIRPNLEGLGPEEDEEAIREQIQWLRSYRKAGRAGTGQESGKVILHLLSIDRFEAAPRNVVTSVFKGSERTGRLHATRKRGLGVVSHPSGA